MSDNKFSSANNDISVKGAKAAASRLNPAAVLSGMTKDVRRRWIIVGTLAGVGVVAAATFMSSGSSTPTRTRQPSDQVVDTTPRGISSEKNWKTETGAELLAIKQSLAESQNAQKDMLARMELMRKDMQQQQANGNKVGTSPLQGGADLSLPPPPAPPKSLTNPPAPPALVSPGSGTGSVAAPATTAPAAAPTRSSARAFIPTSATAEPASTQTTTQEEMVSNDHQGFLPAGSFVNSTLISGVEAFTGGTAQSQPQPVVVRLDANAVLPNAAQYQIKGCHALASVWGDMSSERVFGRLVTLTCVDSRNKLVLSEDVEGVLVDSDGKNGIRGTLQDRQGAKLARSLLAGFAQGVSSAFGAAQSTVTSTALGTTSSILGGDTLKAGGYAGASTAAQQLASFYLKQAEATMPVIAIDAGRKVSVLFTKSKSLHFESTGTYKSNNKKQIVVERTN